MFLVCGWVASLLGAGDFQERGRVHGDCDHKDAMALKYSTAFDVDSVVELVSATVHEPNVKRLMSLTMAESTSHLRHSEAKVLGQCSIARAKNPKIRKRLP